MQGEGTLKDAQVMKFEVGYLNDFYRKKAKEELTEMAGVRELKIRQMRDILKNDNTLKSCSQESDDTLLKFLRARKFSVPRAVATYKQHFNTLKRHKDVFTDVQFDVLRSTVERKFLNFLPYRCPDGCAILLGEIKNWDTKVMSIKDIERLIVLMYEQGIEDVMTQVNGFKIIFDAVGYTFEQLRYFTPHKLYLLNHYCQNCLPARFKSFHIISDSTVFKATWLIIMQFMSSKLKSRVHLHSDHKELLDHFPRSILPVKFGGDLKEYGDIDWLKRATSPENLEKLYGRFT